MSSSDDASGIVTPVAIGIAVITASLGAASGSSNFIVRDAKLQSVSITPMNLAMAKGSKQQFIATGIYSDDSKEDVTLSSKWLSKDSSVKIDNSIANRGLVTTTTAGYADMSASFNGHESHKVRVTITNAVLLSIYLSPNNSSIPLGAAQQYTATGMYDDVTTQNITNSVTWSTSNSTLATINPTGLLTPVVVTSSVLGIASQGAIAGTTTLAITAVTPDVKIPTYRSKNPHLKW